MGLLKRVPGRQLEWMIVTVLLLSHPLQAAVIIPENALSEDGWVSANTAIELRLDESTGESVEDSTKTTAKPRILLGKQDISIFFKKIGEGHYRYQAAIFPLPSGENKLSVYQLTDDPNQPWELITSESLKVLTKSGFQAIENTPLLNANVNTLLAKKSQQARATPDSLQLTMGLENRLQTEKWQLQSNVNLESLVQKQGNQDDLDDVLLNDYLLEWQRDATQVSIGHISDGEHPLLFDAFATRGIKLQYRFNPRFDFVVSSQNGSAITGFSNPVGLATRQHNISALTLGMEFFPVIAGRLRSEFTWMDAKLQAEDDFNELSIPDTQSNRAFGLRLMGRNDKGTVAARVNFARSKQEGLGDGFIDEDVAFDAEFDDEFDDEVDDGFNDDIIALNSQWHNAISAEVSWNVLAPDKKWADRPVSLLANYSFHRIDPEYATVGASINANELRHGIDLTMRVGDISNQLSASTVQDNLDHITSLLTTKTRQWAWTMAIPNKKEKPTDTQYMPSINVSYQNTHQFATNTPDALISVRDNGQRLPDQVTENLSLGLTWQQAKSRWNYRLSYNTLSNKQAGAENTDSRQINQQFSGQYQANDAVTLGFSVAAGRNENESLARASHNLSQQFSLQWRLSPEWSLRHEIARTRQQQVNNLSRSQRINMQLSRDFQLSLFGKKRAAQFLLNAQHQQQEAESNQSNFDSQQSDWQITSGFSINLF